MKTIEQHWRDFHVAHQGIDIPDELIGLIRDGFFIGFMSCHAEWSDLAMKDFPEGKMEEFAKGVLEQLEDFKKAHRLQVLRPDRN